MPAVNNSPVILLSSNVAPYYGDALSEGVSLLYWGPMGWWYWFGAWIALALSVGLIGWAIIETLYYGDGNNQLMKRIKWPLMGIVGLVLQIPALFVLDVERGTGLGTGLAGLGLLGTLFVGVNVAIYFSKAIASGHTIFSSGGTGSHASASFDARRRNDSQEREGLFAINNKDRSSGVRKRSTTPLPSLDSDPGFDPIATKSEASVSNPMVSLVAEDSTKSGHERSHDQTIIEDIEGKNGADMTIIDDEGNSTITRG